MIAGIEFDEEGKCPICQSAEKTKNLKSILPIMNTFPRAKKSRFDVAVFYTGGKDSTYLLYYLSKVLNLRVLALTWEIPYMSECAKKSIENAKQLLDSVEFISRKISRSIFAKKSADCSLVSYTRLNAGLWKNIGFISLMYL